MLFDKVAKWCERKYEQTAESIWNRTEVSLERRGASTELLRWLRACIQRAALFEVDLKDWESFRSAEFGIDHIEWKMTNAIEDYRAPFDHYAIEFVDGVRRDLLLVVNDEDEIIFFICNQASGERLSWLESTSSSCVSIWGAAMSKKPSTTGMVLMRPAVLVEYDPGSDVQAIYEKMNLEDHEFQEGCMSGLGMVFGITRMINHPSYWVTTKSVERARPVKRGAIARSDQRRRYVLLNDREMRRVFKLPSLESEKIAHAPHRRRGHYHLLRSERYREELRGKRIWIKPCWVGPDECVHQGERYKILLDFGRGAGDP